ncbi:hypothetical protein DIPPA_15480 [Diplonema papillatum]|nr:hypothetical protein DIPPA_15480 [Diplonema papillatum]
MDDVEVLRAMFLKGDMRSVPRRKPKTVPHTPPLSKSRPKRLPPPTRLDWDNMHDSRAGRPPVSRRPPALPTFINTTRDRPAATSSSSSSSPAWKPRKHGFIT